MYVCLFRQMTPNSQSIYQLLCSLYIIYTLTTSRATTLCYNIKRFIPTETPDPSFTNAELRHTHIYMYNVLFPKLKIVCLGLKKADMKKKKFDTKHPWPRCNRQSGCGVWNLKKTLSYHSQFDELNLKPVAFTSWRK